MVSNIVDPTAAVQWTIMMNSAKKIIRGRIDDISVKWGRSLTGKPAKGGASEIADQTWRRTPWFRALMGMAGMSYRRDRRTRDKLAERKRVRQKAELTFLAMNNLVSQPAALAAKVEEVTAPIAALPNTREAAQLQLMSMSQYVTENLPMGMSQVIDSSTGRPKILSTDLACRELLQVVGAIDDPLGTLEAYASIDAGAMPPSVRRAIQATFPELYADLALKVEFEVADAANKLAVKQQKRMKKDLIVRGGIADQLGSGGLSADRAQPVSQESLIALSRLTGVPKTPFMDPLIIGVMQSLYQEPDKAPAPTGSAKGVLKRISESHLVQSQKATT